MRHQVQIELLERLLAGRDEPPHESIQGRDPVEFYQDPVRAEAEGRVLFGELPLCLAHMSEVANPGDFVTRQVGDIGILVVHDGRARVQAYVNVCRHRGAPLAHHKEGRGCEAFVCPYHGWVYDLEGTLTHVPGEKFFPNLDKEALGLVPLATACAHGFVWVVPRPQRTSPDGPPPPLDVTDYLGAVADDLAHYQLASHALYRKSERVHACNWKLVIDAFLAGRHLQTLTQHARYRSPGEGGIIFDFFGGHVRSVGARENLEHEASKPRHEWDLRACATPCYLLFPNTMVIVHPDHISVLTIEPMAVDRSYRTHYMLVPELPKSDEERARYDRSFQRIDSAVFQSEEGANDEPG